MRAFVNADADVDADIMFDLTDSYLAKFILSLPRANNSQLGQSLLFLKPLNTAERPLDPSPLP